VVLVLALLLLGPIILSRALGNLGLVVMTRALVADPKAPDAQALAEAERRLKQAVAWDEGNPGAHRGLALALAIQGKHAEAAAEWQAAGLTSLDFIAQGDQVRRAGEYEEALWWYKQAALLEPRLPSSVLYLQYLTLRDGGDLDSALPKLQEGTLLDQGWLDAEMRFRAWYRWGAWLYQQNRRAEAESALAKAIALHPQSQGLLREHSESYRLLGLVQQAQGRLEQAVQSLEMAVRLDEQNAWAHSSFGQALYSYDPQRAPEVEEEFSAALSLRPDDVAFWSNLIRFWLRVGEKERATSLCLQARQQGMVSGLEEVCPAP
jgi:tetratricopeptide (TPR) repeat protein